MRWAFWRRDRREAPVALEPAAPVFYPGSTFAVVEQRQPDPGISIGFRDGSTFEVEPESPQGRALRAVADVLATRDDEGAR